MKFATILDGDRHRFGLVDGDALHLAPAGETLRDHLAGDLAALAQRLRGLPATPLEGVTWAPVVPDPAQILCVGLNYKDHREETRSVTGGAYPEHPIIFTRFATTLAAHGETLPIPRVSEVVDYEAELAVIIGKRRALHRASGRDGSRRGLRAFQRHLDARLADEGRSMGAGQELPEIRPARADDGHPGRGRRHRVWDPPHPRRRGDAAGKLAQLPDLRHPDADLLHLAIPRASARRRDRDRHARGVGFVRKPPVLLAPARLAWSRSTASAGSKTPSPPTEPCRGAGNPAA
ncbi:MAG: fumarylacetoacetate hydrolase family protein [Paracoccaceae bacterium]